MGMPPTDESSRQAKFRPKTRSKRQPKLKRGRHVYEFLVRYPWGLSSINGYRRAAHHFGLHTLEDPSSRGVDSYCLLVHHSARVLREAAGVSATIEAENWDEFYTEMAKRGICVVDHDWKHWCPEDDRKPLASLGLQAKIVEYEEGHFRVTLRKERSTRRRKKVSIRQKDKRR